MYIHIGFAASMVALAGPLLAHDSDVLFSEQKWKVSSNAFEDGSVACAATVLEPSQSFSIWTYPSNAVVLQFESTDWDFGQGDTLGLLEIQIDGNQPWTLDAAALFPTAILFSLNEDEGRERFVSEITTGTQLLLRLADGSGLQNHSLAGAGPAMEALAGCRAAMSDGAKGASN